MSVHSEELARQALKEALLFISCNCGKGQKCAQTCTYSKIKKALKELNKESCDIDRDQLKEVGKDKDLITLDYAMVVEAAREQYCNDECEIDDGPLTSRGDRGCWVQAWVWVAYPEKEE